MYCPISKFGKIDSLSARGAALLPRRPDYRPTGAVYGGGDYSRTGFVETSEEVPYATTVVIEQFEEGVRLTRIAAAIFCEREGQKGILVGKGGQMLKKIGTAARLQIEKMLGKRVFLELFVKVRGNWRDSHEFVEELDWRRQVQRLTAGGKG